MNLQRKGRVQWLKKDIIMEKFDINYLAEPSAIGAQEEDEYDENGAVRSFAQKGNAEVMLVRNSNATYKLDPKFLGPFEVLEQRDDANEHIFELRDLVQDTIRTQHLRNLVPLDIGYESALRAARQNAGEHIVTGVTGHSGDPRKTGSLFFNLQFDGLPEEYPTLFKDCKLCNEVRDYIRKIIVENPDSNFSRLLPQLGEELPQRIRRANQRFDDYVQ